STYGSSRTGTSEISRLRRRGSGRRHEFSRRRSPAAPPPASGLAAQSPYRRGAQRGLLGRRPLPAGCHSAYRVVAARPPHRRSPRHRSEPHQSPRRSPSPSPYPRAFRGALRLSLAADQRHAGQHQRRRGAEQSPYRGPGRRYPGSRARPQPCPGGGGIAARGRRRLLSPFRLRPHRHRPHPLLVAAARPCSAPARTKPSAISAPASSPAAPTRNAARAPCVTAAASPLDWPAKAAKTAPSTAMPKVAPIMRAVLTNPDAVPERAGGTAATATELTGPVLRPSPTPMMASPRASAR